jgi:tRNA A58 N-methylase Trm61
MKYIIHFSEENLFNKTLGPPSLYRLLFFILIILFHLIKDVTSTLDEQNWKKITLDIHRPSSTIETPTTQSNQKSKIQVFSDL